MTFGKKKLRELFKIGSSKRVLKADWKDKGVPFYRGREITKLSIEGSVVNDLFISEEHFKNLSAKHGVPKKGDLVITAIGTIGNTYIVKEKDRFYFKDASVLWLHKTSNVDSKFIDYWFKSSIFSNQLKLGNGATVDTLSIAKLNEMELCVPFQDEQKRIVAKLDKAFEEIDKAIKLLEIKEGEVKKLKNSLLREVLSVEDEKWKIFKLEDICQLITKGTTPTSVGYKFESNGINFIKVESITLSGTFIPSKFAKISEDCHKALRRSQLIEGDILFSIAGALGRTGIVTKEVIPANTNQALAILRLKSNIKVDKKFLFFTLNSEGVKQQSNDNKAGVAQKNLSLSQLKNYVIHLPDYEHQKRIVAKLDKAFEEIDKAIRIINKSKNNYEALKSSLLRQELQKESAA